METFDSELEPESKLERKRRKARERKARWKAKLDEVSKARIRETEANRNYLKRHIMEMPEEALARRKAEASGGRCRRDDEPSEFLLAMRRANTLAQRRRRANLDPETAARQREADAARRRKAREEETPEAAEARRWANTLAQRRRRANLDPETAARRREANAARKRKVRGKEGEIH
ncbi:uncharacterized protein C05D11.13-like [Physella acuta]|uniref:uncharacterized protein C05D11.13-like n=1 Tax=Physella acuta TaxID=109671 RepID=UPI0027DE70FA|nr:uncharacterized protein C05D11.13-like [Physella acuta]XP_059176605.1 uncharacterized protein C05D11.13-like [Physella acuta]